MLILTAGLAAFGQSKAEQEVLKFNSDYDQAQMNRDAAFFERALANDYTFSGPTAEIEDKAKAIAWIREQKAKPTYKLVSVKTEDVKVRVMGEKMAILTGTWIGTSSSLSDDKAEPHTDRGRYTAVLEKRGDQWVILAEHVSEAQHDRKLMEQQVMKAGQAYNDMIKRNDVAAIDKILANEYMYTTSNGSVQTREEEIARYKSSKIKFESSEMTDQKVRVIGNGSAIETATFRVKGTNDSKPFDETERYTTVWVWRDGRWQIAADHTSMLKR